MVMQAKSYKRGPWSPGLRIAAASLSGQASGEFVGAAFAGRGGHRVAAGHGQHIADTALVQLPAQMRVGAVDLIASHPRCGCPAVESAHEQLAGQRRFGRELHLVRYPGFGAATGILGPALG
jgi:hypothetical protein